MTGFITKSKITWPLALFSVLSIVLISYLKNSLELEDAEQAYYSQWWRWGYDDQPPLYTWLQKIVNYCFGVTKFSFSLLRGLLFASILLLLAKFGKKVLDETKKAQLVMLASVLIPVFIDFAFRRLSHTLLASLTIMITYLIVAKLVQKKSSYNYLLLGVAMGIGMLAKYNYALFPASLFIASFFNADLKAIIWNRRVLLSCIVAVALVFPHLYWLLHDGYLIEIKRSLGAKFGDSDPGIIVVGPILKMSKALLEGMLPILLLLVGLFFFRKKNLQTNKKLRWLLHLGIVQFGVLLIFFVLMDAQDVHGRWLLPLLLPYLVLFVAFLGSIKNNYIKWGTIIYISVLCFQVLRTPLEKLLGIKSDIHFEYTALEQKLHKEFPKETWVLPNVTYGGQIRLLDPTRKIFTLDDFSATLPKTFKNGCSVVSTQKESFTSTAVDSLLQYGPDDDDLYFFKVDLTSEIPFE
ncbi:ArnT family glycosyltransferase [Flagellimonas pacifica]|uniref:Dolichyl-phosphate-mannose-protein mannosyltransferase n=1 Tax=Flagellimonas pacifica TaxID=1247520 RepID=A0A285MQD5_9FLAO|nr:glycosyltransferase family 39 protein [Allomuricauda parva]SNY99385.1 Dolichyl-phosphate-mannose-protein mannosyltransferase [Allomuricauda parva]